MSKTNSQNHQNDAYLCFSGSDADFAEVLEDALLRYKTVGGEQHSRHLRVFQDSPELSGSGYAALLTQQLQRSRKMIVICSEAAGRDETLNGKVREFIAFHGGENVIPIAAVGEDFTEMTPLAWLPSALRNAPMKPEVIVFSDVDPDAGLPDKTAKNRAARAELLGRITGQPAEEILQIESQRTHRRKKQRNALLSSAVILLIAIAGGMMWQKFHEDKLQNRTAAAELLIQRGKLAEQDNQHLLSLHLLAEALAMRPDAGLADDILQAMRPLLPHTRLIKIIRHDHAVTGACYNRARTVFATWDNGGVIQFWNARTGQAFSSPLLHGGEVHGVIFIENDQQLLSWGSDGLLRRWNVAAAKTVAKPLRLENVIDLQLSKDESRALARCEDFAVRLIDPQRWKVLGEAAHDGWIGGAIFNAAETEFITWSDDSTLRRWDAFSIKPLGKPLKHRSEINGAIYFGNEKRILSWGNDGAIEQWNAATSRRVGIRFQHDDAVIGASLSSDGRRLLSWSRDKTARLWDMRTGNLSIPPLRHAGWVFGAQVNPAKTAILTWSFDNTLRLWDANTGEVLGAPMRHSSSDFATAHGVFGAAISGDGRQILSWGADNAIRLWDLPIQNQLGTAMLHGGKISGPHHIGAIFSPDFSEILTWSADSTARLWKKIDPTNIFAAITTANVTQIVQALTGTRLDSPARKVVCLSPAEWADCCKALADKPLFATQK